MIEKFKAMSPATVESFWAGADHYRTTRSGFRQLCEMLGKKPPWFHRQMLERCPKLFVPVRARTLSRFLRDDATKSLGRAPWLSGLLVTCEDVIKTSGCAIGDEHIAVRALVVLSEKFREQYGVDLPSSNAAGESCPTDIETEARTYSRALLTSIVRHIHQPSDADTLLPEFPPGSPRWPATPCDEYDYDGRRFLLKDESQNPTGTHKDRWAWEKLVYYKKIIKDALETGGDPVTLRAYSMISSGSAALALQSLLRLYQLPDLHVAIAASRPKQRVIDKLEIHGAKVKEIDLKDDPLSEEQVRIQTDNPDGIDVTPRYARESFDNHHYDWLVYEILEKEPKHIFVPFGSGGLFANIMYTIEALKKGRTDTRLSHGSQSIENINIYGSTSDDPKTNMEMLFAYHRPTLPGIEQDLARFVADGTLGSRSAIVDIGNDEAIAAVKWAHGKAIRTDYSGAAGLALFMRLCRAIPSEEKVLVVNTGAIVLPPARGP